MTSMNKEAMEVYRRQNEHRAGDIVRVTLGECGEDQGSYRVLKDFNLCDVAPMYMKVAEQIERGPVPRPKPIVDGYLYWLEREGYLQFIAETTMWLGTNSWISGYDCE